MQRWDIKYHWVPVDLEANTKIEGDYTIMSWTPWWKDGFKKAFAEAELLANDGWELVSVAPSQTGVAIAWVPAPNDSSMIDHGQLGQSYGVGSTLMGTCLS